MMTLKHTSVGDCEDSSTPLLSEADSTESQSDNHREPESKDFFIRRERNLALSCVLLVSCYSAVLIPAYLSAKQPNWTNDSSREGDMVALNRSAALLSRPCQPGWSGRRLRSVPSCSALLEIAVFLQDGAAEWELPPPLGLQGSEATVAQAMQLLPQTGLPSSLVQGSCRRCMVVGSGGVLHGGHLGGHIDQYDVIIRMNNAPVSGFEKDAGSRTTLRLMYPEGAPHSTREYRNTAIVALVTFKSLDLEWLTSVVAKQPLSWWSKLWFWREVIESIPLQPENFRILNPEIMHKTGVALQSYTKQQRKMVPTLGAAAVVLALQLCDEVSLAGFGYDLQHPGALLHYYESLRMDAMATQVVHDISAETLFLRELVKAGVVNDLTGAL